jgi:hypothetical protein
LARNEYSTQDYDGFSSRSSRGCDAEQRNDMIEDENDVIKDACFKDVRLPVFCCSSIEYMCLAGLLKEQAAVFRDIFETGVPALQDFLYSSTTRYKYN